MIDTRTARGMPEIAPDARRLVILTLDVRAVNVVSHRWWYRRPASRVVAAVGA